MSGLADIKGVIRRAQVQWMTSTEAADILEKFSSYGFPISSSAPIRPSSGSLFLYNMQLGTRWRVDGYEWNPPSEDEITVESCPSGSLECVSSRSAPTGTAEPPMIRRSYWLRAAPNVILTHYLLGSAAPTARKQSGALYDETVDSMLSATTEDKPPVQSIFTTGIGSDLMMNVGASDGAQPESQFIGNVFADDTQIGIASKPSVGSGMRRIRTSPADLSSLSMSGVVDGSDFAPQPLSSPDLFTGTSGARSDQLGGESSMVAGALGDGPTDLFSDFRSSQNSRQPKKYRPEGLYGSGLSSSKASARRTPTRGGAEKSPGMRRIVSMPTMLKSGVAGPSNSVDKLLKRKARKAEVARACRKRKKAYIESLEQKTVALQKRLSDIAHAQDNYRAQESAQSSDIENRLRQMETILLGQRAHGLGGDAKKLSQHISEFLSKRRQFRDAHNTFFEQASRRIKPGLQTKFALWVLDQEETFYSRQGGDALKQNSLWQTLASELGLTPEQSAGLLEKRSRFRENRQEQLRLQNRLLMLQHDVERHLRSRTTLVDEFVETLGPIRAAKLFVWVQKNPNCMRTLRSQRDAPVSSEAPSELMTVLNQA